jgi:hypothetical protein
MEDASIHQELQTILIDERMDRFIKMTDDDKDNLTCDDVFCLYLGDVCKQVNPTYFKIVLKFIILYRDCLNELGWQKRREHFIKSDIPINDDDLYQRIKE